jgi:hypothetical protein
MITTLTCGGHYERAVQFYFCSGSFATARWIRRLDQGRDRSSVTATQACLELGGDQGGDGQTVAQGGQKRRWWTRLAWACGLVCALVGLDECQAARFAADGALLGGEREGQLWARVRDHSNIPRAQASLGVAGWQEVNDLIVGEATRLGFGQVEIGSSDTAVQEPALGYPNEAGIMRGVAQRVYRSRVKEKGLEAVEAGKEGESDLQDGQRRPAVCQEPRAERSSLASTRRADRGVERAQPGGDQAGGPQRRESNPIGGQEKGADGRAERHLAAAD